MQIPSEKPQIPPTGGANSGARADGLAPKRPVVDPDLGAVIKAWPDLPAAIKAGVVAMVKAARE
jgi:hypothetical protein